MTKAATAINSFAPVAQQTDFVPPAEQLITLTIGQLQGLITQAIEKAIQPLQNRIESLEAIVARQGKEIAALDATQSTQGENQFIQLQLIGQLRDAPQRTIATALPRGDKTQARIAKIDEVLKSRGPTTLKQLEHILGIDRATMTRLLGKLDKRRYELHSRPGDDREKVLRLKVQIR